MRQEDADLFLGVTESAVVIYCSLRHNIETADITHDAPVLSVPSAVPFSSRAAQVVSPALYMTLKYSDLTRSR
jgi:hypothetical protein